MFLYNRISRIKKELNTDKKEDEFTKKVKVK